MSDIDLIINVSANNVKSVTDLSASLRGLNANLKGIIQPMSKLDAHTLAFNKALGLTSRGANNHAKSLKDLARNQQALAAETRRLTRDMQTMGLAMKYAGGQNTGFGKFASGAITQMKALRSSMGMLRLQAFGSDLQSISLRMQRIGKDAQFVGRSLMINLTAPIMLFARMGFQQLLRVDEQLTRLTKVLDNVARSADQARAKLGISPDEVLTPETQKRVDGLVNSFRQLDNSLTEISSTFGVAKDLVVGIASDFAELGLTSGESIAQLTKMVTQIEKLGGMDISGAQDLTQALYFQSRRALEANGELAKLGTTMEREMRVIGAARTQMFLFNAIENVTALTLKDLGDAFPEVGSAATTFGLSMTEAAALLAPMKAAGLDVGASANSIKVSLQRMVAPTKQNVEYLASLRGILGKTAEQQAAFDKATKTGLTGLQALTEVFDLVSQSGKNTEAALVLMSELFEKRQGPRMVLAIEQLRQFNAELAKTGSGSAERRLANVAEVAAAKFSGLNAQFPKTIKNFKDIGIIARLATAQVGQDIEGYGKATIRDIEAAIEIRKAVSDEILSASRKENRDLLAEVKSETGRAFMVELAGAANAGSIAQRELDAALSTVGVTVSRLKNDFKLFAADIISGFVPVIEKVQQIVSNLYQRWNAASEETRNTIRGLIVGLATFLAALAPVVLALGTAQSVIGLTGRSISMLLPKLKTAEGGYTAVGKAAKYASDQLNAFYKLTIGSSLQKMGIGVAGGQAVAQKGATQIIPTGARSARRGAKGYMEVFDPLTGQIRSSTTPTGLAAVGAYAQAEAGMLKRSGLDFTYNYRNKYNFMQKGGSTSRAPMMRTTAPTGVRGITARLGALGGRLIGLPTPGTGIVTSAQARPFFDPNSPLQKISNVLQSRRLATAGSRQEVFSRLAEAYGRREAILAGDQRIGGDAMQRTFRGRNISEGRALAIARGGIRGQLTARFTGIQALPANVASGFAKSVSGAKAAVRALAIENMAVGKGAPGIFRSMAVAMKGFMTSTNLGTRALKLLKLTLISSGIGAILIAVGVAVALVVKNLDRFKEIGGGAIEKVKNAFNILKDAAMEVIRPIIDLFASFSDGQGGAEGALSGIAGLFDKVASVIQYVAGLVKKFVVNVIQPYMYFIVNIIKAVIEAFQGNWGEAFKFLKAGVANAATAIVNLFALAFKAIIRATFKLVEGIVRMLILGISKGVGVFGDLPIVGGLFKKAAAGLDSLNKKVGAAATAIANGVSGAIDAVAKGITGKLSGAADSGVAKSKGKLELAIPDFRKTGADLGTATGEAITNAMGDAIDTEDLKDKIAKATEKNLEDLAQQLYDFVVKRFEENLNKVAKAGEDALKKQKEAAEKVYDTQIDTLEKLERAEESLTRTKEFENRMRELIDQRALQQANYIRNRALAIYEGRIDDARMLDLEQQRNLQDSQKQESDIVGARRADLAKENLNALKEAINEAKRVAGEFFDVELQKYKDATEKILQIPPSTIEQYEEQWNQLGEVARNAAETANVGFGEMFEKFATTINEKMPNQVVGAFTTNLDELVAVATQKYGLGADAGDNTIIGVTLGMLTSMGDTFGTGKASVVEKFGQIAVDMGSGLKTALDTILLNTKEQFLKPFEAQFTASKPMDVYVQAIADGNLTILREFEKTLKYNEELRNKMIAALDPAVKKWAELKAQIEETGAAAANAANAMNGTGPGSTGGTGYYVTPYGAMVKSTAGVTTIGAPAGVASRSFVSRLASASAVGRQGLVFTGLQRKLGGYVPGLMNKAIPAMLHGGEYVLNAESVKSLGIGYLDKLNQARFSAPRAGMGNPGYGGQSASVSTVNINVDTFIGEEEWFRSMMKDYNINILPREQKIAGTEVRSFTTYSGINQV